ncbi:MAG: hypothetical protein IKV82_00220 [Akkermansia sp.]|nr:hypothetical protein [Akkermansia sp.]
MGEEQTDFKKEMKQWLRERGLGYRWVAEQCGVSEITVRNWMSQKNIPPLKKQLLERVMVQVPVAAGRAETGADLPGVSVRASFALTVQLEASMYERLANRASAEGTSMEHMVATAIAKLVNEGDATFTAGGLRARKVLLPTEL